MQHKKDCETENSTLIRQFLYIPLYFVQILVPDDDLMLGRNMLH